MINIIETNLLKKIIRFVKINANIALIIAGILVLFFDIIYNLLSGSISFGATDQLVLLFGVCCIFLGLMQKSRFELEDVIEDIEGGARREEMEEKKREMEFVKKYPTISRVWGVRWVVKWAYKEGGRYVVGLIIILILFVAIRAAYMDYSFGGVAHSDKYASYLPNLISMYENHNPFLNQNLGYVSIFDNDPNPSLKKFGELPFFGWAFLFFMPLTEIISLELLIRTLLTALGMILLFLIYLFFKNIFDKKIALLGILLLAFNQLFQLITYTTVMDLPALIFMFIALNLYLNEKNDLSYLFCGLSILAKYSFLLITFPALAFLIIYKDTSDLYNLGKLGFYSVLPMVLYKVLIKPIPSKTFTEGIIILLLTLIITYIVYFFITNNDNRFRKIINTIDVKIRYFLIFFVPILLIFIFSDTIAAFAPEFLTDGSLIFNLAMYFAILNMIKVLVPNVLFIIFPLGLLLSIPHKKGREISLAILFSSVIYLIAASKVIYFHIYYKHIFVFVVVLSSLYILSFIDKIKVNKVVKITLVGIIISTLLISSYDSSKDMLNRQFDGTLEMSIYLENNLDETDIILRTGGEPRIFVIYNTVKMHNQAFYGNELELLKKRIKERGFVEAFDYYNVRYYLSHGEGNFKEFTYLLTDEVNKSSYNRRDLILDQLGQVKYHTVDIDEYYETHKPEQYFKLERKIGDWYLYRIE